MCIRKTMMQKNEVSPTRGGLGEERESARW